MESDKRFEWNMWENRIYTLFRKESLCDHTNIYSRDEYYSCDFWDKAFTASEHWYHNKINFGD